MKEVYDVGIIGGGVAGAFAALRAAENFKNSKAILFDIGRPPLKRRRQLEGWLGCLPFGDGKIHVDDVYNVMEYVDGRRAKPAHKWVHNKFSQSGPTRVTKDKMPSVAVQKRAEKLGFDIITNNYIQWKPDSIHKLSRFISDGIKKTGNVTFSFDNQVHQILKKGNSFLVSTDHGDYYCNKILLCAGRSGWRWVNDLYNSFDLIVDDNVARFGITVETSAQHMKEFNKSHCTFSREDLEIGPLNWNGTIIPEDHADLVVSAFRSNEERWKTDKVSFKLIGNIPSENNGVYEAERISKLSFLLFNDRVGKEKIRSIIKKKSTLSQLPEYNWLIEKLEELEGLFPSIISKGSFHAPTIQPRVSQINISSNLETEVPGLFVTGESAGMFGIGSAAISGVVAMDSALR